MHCTLRTFIKIRFNCSHSPSLFLRILASLAHFLLPLLQCFSTSPPFSSCIHTFTSALRQTMRMCIRKESNENNSISLTAESSSLPSDQVHSPSSAGHLSLHHFLEHPTRLLSINLSHNDSDKSAPFVSRKSVHESFLPNSDSSHLKNLNKLSWPLLSSHTSRYTRLSSPPPPPPSHPHSLLSADPASISPSCTKSLLAAAAMAANVTSGGTNGSHSIVGSRSSTSSFCIDALLSRDKQQSSSSAVFNQRLHSQSQSQSHHQQQQPSLPLPPPPQQSPTPTASTDLDASNNSTSPRIFSPLGSDESRANSTCVTDDRSNSPVSNTTSGNMWSASCINGQSSHHRSVISTHPSLLPPNSSSSSSHPVSSGHPLHPLFHASGPPNASLYAAMYSGNSPLHAAAAAAASSSASGHHAALTLLPHASAFHAPLGDLKNQAAAAAAASSLSMDWFTRAGLLYHRTPGKFCPLASFVSSFLPPQVHLIWSNGQLSCVYSAPSKKEAPERTIKCVSRSYSFT